MDFPNGAYRISLEDVPINRSTLKIPSFLGLSQENCQNCYFLSKVASLKLNLKMFPIVEKYLLWHIKNAATFFVSTFYQISYPLFIFQHSAPQHFLLLKRNPEASNFLPDAWLLKEECRLSC